MQENWAMTAIVEYCGRIGGFGSYFTLAALNSRIADTLTVIEELHKWLDIFMYRHVSFVIHCEEDFNPRSPVVNPKPEAYCKPLHNKYE